MPLIKNAKTTDAQYRKAVALFEKNRIIGEPLGTPGFDTKTRLLKVWPNREPIQLKTANEFNEELDELLARHCKSEDGYADDSMMGDQQIQWHPISMLPTFTFMVDGMLEESLVQLSNMRRVVDKPHVLDDATLNRVFDLYDKQLDDQQHYPPSSVLRRHPTTYWLLSFSLCYHLSDILCSC